MLATRTAAASALPSLAPFLAYLRLEVRRSLRNRRYLVFTIVFPVLLYVLYTAVVPTGSDPDATLDGLTWPVYFLVSMAAYGAIGAAMSQAVPVATERRQGWARQLRVTPLPSLAYVATKVVSAVLLTIPALALVGLAGQVINHVDIGRLHVGRHDRRARAHVDPVRGPGPVDRVHAGRRERPGRDGPVLLHARDPRRPVHPAPDAAGWDRYDWARAPFVPLTRTSAGPSWRGSSPIPSTSSSSPRGPSRLGALAAWRYVADERSGRA